MKKLTGFTVFASMILGLICLFSDICSAQDKTITLRYSTMFPMGDPLSVITEEWCKEVEKRTNGKIKVRYYPASTLASPVQAYESVVKGVVDVANVPLAYTKGRFPIILGVGGNAIEYPNALTATRMINAVYVKFKPKEFDDTKVMYFNSTGEAMIHTVKKQVTSLDDLKGMRIRTMDANGEILSSLGASPVAMPAGEVYDAMSKGVIDGVTAVYGSLKSFKTADILKYTLDMRGSAFLAIFAVVMNKDKWNSIPPESQQIIEQINKEWIDKHGRVYDAVDKQGMEYGLSKGMKITKISAKDQARWNAAAQRYTSKYIAEMKQKNLPGEEMLKFVRQNLKKVQQ